MFSATVSAATAKEGKMVIMYYTVYIDIDDSVCIPSAPTTNDKEDKYRMMGL